MTASFLLSLFGVPSAQAQRVYRLEVGAAGGFTSFDKATDLSNSAGGAFRIGYWLLGPLSLEGEVGIAPTKSTPAESTVTYTSLSAGALYNFTIGTYNTLFLKAGYSNVRYRRSTPCVPIIPGAGACGTAGAFVGGVGARIALSPTVMWRTEAAVNRSNTSIKFSNVVLTSGVSLMIGSKPLRDADGDRVYDRYDRCEATPAGALVDKRGCPTDTDADGVFDGLDRCPNTPKGAAVDPVGCTTDSDEDGVLDGLDKCENTPKGAVIDPNGCPRDEDQDSILDGLDRCPNTPLGARVDALGCPGDDDNDGVFDGLDKCPGTPAGMAVNAFGCPPNQDSDGDGVRDAFDRCPDTPAGSKVDPNGCPPAAPQPAPQEAPPSAGAQPQPAQPAPNPPVPRQPTGAGKVWIVPGQAFALQSARLLPESRAVLDSVVSELLSNPFARAEISGFAQDRLVPSDNLRLSRLRAEAVRSYIVGQGVPANRLTAKGLGSQTLLVADTTESARVLNRRVELRLVPPGP